MRKQLFKAIDDLQRAESILAAMAVSLDYGSDLDIQLQPDYAEIARMACELIRGSLGRLQT